MTLDAFKGYQVKLNPEFRKFTAFQTPFGRYRYIRLAMGLSSALDIFTTRYSNVVINTIGGRCTEDTLIQHNVDQEERQHQSWCLDKNPILQSWEGKHCQQWRGQPVSVIDRHSWPVRMEKLQLRCYTTDRSTITWLESSSRCTSISRQTSTRMAGQKKQINLHPDLESFWSHRENLSINNDRFFIKNGWLLFPAGLCQTYLQWLLGIHQQAKKMEARAGRSI